MIQTMCCARVKGKHHASWGPMLSNGTFILIILSVMSMFDGGTMLLKNDRIKLTETPRPLGVGINNNNIIYVEILVNLKS